MNLLHTENAFVLSARGLINQRNVAHLFQGKPREESGRKFSQLSLFLGVSRFTASPWPQTVPPRPRCRPSRPPPCAARWALPRRPRGGRRSPLAARRSPRVGSRHRQCAAGTRAPREPFSSRAPFFMRSGPTSSFLGRQRVHCIYEKEHTRAVTEWEISVLRNSKT